MKLINFTFAILLLLSVNSLVKAQREVPENPDGYYELMFNKLISGNEYMASGNEPFWNLDLDLEGNLVFSMAEVNTPITIPATDLKMSTRGKIISFSNNEQKFKVEFKRGKCFDDMSGNQFDYAVTVKYNDVIFKGCGNKLDGWILNDIFGLIEIGGESVRDMNLSKQVMIELHLKDKRIAGNDGCNSFSGGIKYAIFGKIKFNEGFSSTKMFCGENGGFETRFYSALKSADSYTFKKLRLKFFSGGKEVLEFVKMD
jgi:heat shock protein HslJ